MFITIRKEIQSLTFIFKWWKVIAFKRRRGISGHASLKTGHWCYKGLIKNFLMNFDAE